MVRLRLIIKWIARDGDRGMLTTVRIRALVVPADLDRISALNGTDLR